MSKRHHMKPFNVAHGYCHKVANFRIPRGAFFGRDKVSYWYCINKELYPLDTPTLEIYRYDMKNDEWVLLIEQSETVKMIVENATPADWSMSIEYPKFRGIHQISSCVEMKSKSFQTIPDVSNFKKLQTAYENRHNNKFNQPMDIWESIAPISYEEKAGKHTIKRPKWRKCQYTKKSKPYIVRNVCCE